MLEERKRKGDLAPPPHLPELMKAAALTSPQEVLKKPLQVSQVARPEPNPKLRFLCGCERVEYAELICISSR